MKIESDDNLPSRKKFIFFTIGIVSLVTTARVLLGFDRKKEIKKVKMLTQDGKLVEVDAAKLPAKRKKIKDSEIHSWVQRKPSL